MRKLSLLSTLAALSFWAPVASAQSPIYGLDVRLQRFFHTDTGNFVGNFTVVGPNTNPVFAIDFDQNASVLWGVHNTSMQYGTFNLTTGVFNPVGTVSGPTTGASGLTCDVNGVWYLCSIAPGIGSQLWVGDVTTGTFALVGLIDPGLIIDISIDSQGNLYGNNITDDFLYSINTTTGAGTAIGPTGQPTNFAQGMDFDWSNDKLYATLYTGGGTGVFAEMNLATGAAIVIQSTTSLNAEMEMAVRALPGSTTVGTNYCFGDGTGSSCPCGNTGGAGQGCANGFGSGATITASGSAVAANNDLVFNAVGMPPNHSALLFVGTAPLAGTPLGDGLRCVGGSTLRLNTLVTSGSGTATWGPGLNTGLWNAGDMRYFQGWYRDTSTPCGTFFNFTNGVEVTFQ